MRAEVLVVHAWDASFVALVDALVTHMRGDTHVALWLHAFAINQLEHDVVLLEVVKARLPAAAPPACDDPTAPHLR